VTSASLTRSGHRLDDLAAFVIGRKTIKKRMLRQLRVLKMLRKRMHDPIAKTGAWLNQMLKG
jgi:RNA-directed DNA polymerase